MAWPNCAENQGKRFYTNSSMSQSKTQNGQIQIKLIRSGIGFPMKQKKVIQGLGFSRLNQVVTRPDTPEIRGMVFKIRHLVEIVGQ